MKTQKVKIGKIKTNPNNPRLKREQEAYDKEYGVGGIPKILRPE